jgi:hypothetical protein
MAGKLSHEEATNRLATSVGPFDALSVVGDGHPRATNGGGPEDQDQRPIADVIVDG